MNPKERWEEQEEREAWEDFEAARAAWLSRLMFGWMHPFIEMPAGSPPDPPDGDA